MAKKIFLVIVLLSVIVGKYLDAAEEPSTSPKNVTVSRDATKIRETRFARPFYGFIGIWNTLGNIRRIFVGQKNETTNALQRILNILSDGFTDTATKKPQTAIETTTSDANDSQSMDSLNGTTAATTTTTERYRISRRELGYILGRNYRGLQKLFRIELNDALNQSQYNIKEYHREAGNSIAKYTIPKEVQPVESSKT